MIRLIPIVLIALAAALVVGTTAVAPARSEPLVWEPTGLTQTVHRLFTPTSGALLAAPATSRDASVALAPFQSDDGGATWRQVQLPPELSHPAEAGVVVDPANHDILYTIGEEGLYKTEDSGATWRKIDGPEIPRFAHFMALDVSPADPRVVYAAVKTQYGGAPPWDWWVRRSDDGGATWQDIEQRDAGYYYAFWISSFYPHPTDPNRALRALGGGGGGVNGHSLELSVDRGVTWTEVIHSGGGRDQWYPRCSRQIGSARST